MMSKITDFMIDFIGADISREEGRVMKAVGPRVVWRLALMVFIAYSMGWLAIIGFVGFAKAGDIERRVAPISVAVDRLAAAVQLQAQAATEQTLQLLRVAIVDARVKQCHANKEETRTIYRGQISEANERYRSLMGQYYPVPSCSDL